MGACALLLWLFVGAFTLAPRPPVLVLSQNAKCFPSHAPSPALEKFVDPLPKPRVINISSGQPITLGAYKIKQRYHRDLPESTIYAYGTSKDSASAPGPTLEAVRGVPSHIRWENHIKDKDHIFVVDRTLYWANPTKGGVPTVTHLHGAEVESSSDGHPEAWFTHKGETGKTFKSQNYTYPNGQEPTTLWYHDHAIGITRLNVYAGLAGLYLLRAKDEDKLGLPRGDYEYPLVLQSAQFYENGTLQFPTKGDLPLIHPAWCPEFYGDVLLVNGKAWPYLDVEPRLYRFRILVATNSRFFTLSLTNSSIPVVQIGSDGGFLRKPVLLPSNITIGPAERLDILIDFSGLETGTKVYMKNSAVSPYPVGYPIFVNENTEVVMKFNVVAKGRNPSSSWGVPMKLPARVEKISRKGAFIRNLTLLQKDDSGGNSVEVLLNNLKWTDPVTETPSVGGVEIWRLINTNNRTHPIHVHLINFRVLDQQAFDVAKYNAGNCSLDATYHDKSKTCYTEKRRKPDPTQIGWKDTVLASPGVVTRVLMRFAAAGNKLFSFDATAEPGYLWHCHMIDHEDNDMMRPMKLQKA